MTKLMPFGAGLALSLLATTMLSGTAVAAAADSTTGEQIAQRWCAACHAVALTSPKVTTEAAPFAEIAKDPEFDEQRLAFFLLDPHPKMPNMSLTRAEAADLAAYINSLRR